VLLNKRKGQPFRSKDQPNYRMKKEKEKKSFTQYYEEKNARRDRDGRRQTTYYGGTGKEVGKRQRKKEDFHSPWEEKIDIPPKTTDP